MKSKRLWPLLSLMILLSISPFVNSLYLYPQQAPFSISVEPEKTTAKPGDDVTFTIEISADPGFNDSIALVLEVEVVSEYEMFDLGAQDPPYPKQFQYTVTIPEEVPASVTAYGTITASSIDHTVMEEVQVTIKSGNIIGDIVGWILGVIRAISNWFSNLFG